MKKNQRFIAGAVCPQCNEMDSLLLNNNDQSIECVDCGFQQSEDEREEQHKQKIEQTKTLPNKVDVSSIIRITNLKN